MKFYNPPGSPFPKTTHPPTAVQLDIYATDSQPRYHIRGGNLGGRYAVANVHFHWGGSEHTVHQRRYAMESHLVAYAVRFGSVAEALHQPRGIAVLATLWQLDAADNPALQAILNSAAFVQDELNVEEPLFRALSYMDLLPDDLGTYFRYFGSLTTPGCAESVVWTVFTTPLLVSEVQVAQFRGTLGTHGCRLGHNWRQPQPRNERPVVFVRPDGKAMDGDQTEWVFLFGFTR